jgi:preprotein translocase SecE subunit
MNVRKFVSEVNRESKRVRWPKTDVLLGSIFVVLAITIFAAFTLTIGDLAVAELLGQLRAAFEGLR